MHDVTNRSRVDVEAVVRNARLLITRFEDVLRRLDYGRAAEALPLRGSSHRPPYDHDAALALTVSFHLMSLVEQREAAFYRARAERDDQVESGLFRSTLAALGARALADLSRALNDVYVQPVFTAHPTEARRTSTLELYRELSQALADCTDLGALSDEERETLEALLERLFRAGEVRVRKPEIREEQAVVIDLLTRVMPGALGLLSRRLDDAWRTAGLPARAGEGPRVRFGTWVGGDRDGHPLVTPEITRQALLAYREAALTLHRGALTRLAARLGISGLREPPPEVLQRALERLPSLLAPERAREALTRNPEEPFRTFVNLLLARLPASADRPRGPGEYRSSTELLEDLAVLADALFQIRAERIAHVELEPIVRNVRAFGLHLAALDIRQNSHAHDLALEGLLALSGASDTRFSTWDEEHRLAFLRAELESRRPFAAPFTELPAEVRSVTGALDVLSAWIRAHGTSGLGSLIVSMTRSVSDLLVPYVLSREAGLLQDCPEGPVHPLAIVPLFETIEDLLAAPAILDGYLSTPIVRRSLLHRARVGGQREPIQQVMIGYSDSNKDGGIVASLWALHRAERTLSEVTGKHGVVVRFFHGRGGSLSRGAGPTHRFLSAQPEGSLTAGLRLTEQGETIFQKYGTPEAAAYNLELLTAGTMRRIAHAQPDQDDPALHDAMDRVAQEARRAYEQLLETPGFIQFFRQATPIDVLETSGIGSRPSRRTGQHTLQDLRAIPWVFAWAQARFALTGWYGFGSGFAALQQSHPELYRRLIERALHWPIARYLVSNVSVSILSADLSVAREYATLVRDEALRNAVMAKIEREAHLTNTALENIYGGPLATARARVAKLLVLRSEGLALANRWQRELLARWREGGATDEELRRALLGTVNAIAAGLRVTG